MYGVDFSALLLLSSITLSATLLVSEFLAEFERLRRVDARYITDRVPRGTSSLGTDDTLRHFECSL